jgi:hypothetical protein
MAEPLTFETFSPNRDGFKGTVAADGRPDGRDGVYAIGADRDHPFGVAWEIAGAFDYFPTTVPNVENLGGLIAVTSPEKELQKNIEFIRQTLSQPGHDPIEISRDWAIRTGLLNQVDRYYAGENAPEGDLDLALVSGGVRNWIQRRTDRLIELTKTRNINSVLLASGNRKMNKVEGPDVEEGMTEADYMEQIIVPKLGEAGLSSELLKVQSGSGNEVMAATADKVKDLINLSSGKIVVVGNAGNWVQNAGQFRRAIKSVDSTFDVDGNQLEVVSDSFPLGTGVEPTTTHQNPLSAVGQIVRNFQEFTRH